MCDGRNQYRRYHYLNLALSCFVVQGVIEVGNQWVNHHQATATAVVQVQQVVVVVQAPVLAPAAASPVVKEDLLPVCRSR